MAPPTTNHPTNVAAPAVARPLFARRCIALLLLASLTLLGGCRAPIGADKRPVSSVYRDLSQNAILGRKYSDLTRAVLHRYDAEKSFARDPANTLKQLHQHALTDNRRDLLLALAELNYFRAEHLRRAVKPIERRQARDYFLASSIYAYYYLLAEMADSQASPFRSRPELARYFYNCALAQALLAPAATNTIVHLQEQTRQLLIGPVDVRLNTNAFPFPLTLFSEFVMADAYVVQGLSVRNRQPGFGAPLIATAARNAQDKAPPRLAVTVFLRVEGSLKDWSAGQIKASLEVYPGYQDAQVKLAGQDVPLEVDATAPLAYALNNTTLRSLGLRQFFSSRELMKSGIYRLQPYQPGAIPVVFVHGTFSTPTCWAEMWNTLSSDPVLSRRYQLWAFFYNTGNPVVWSAANLRDALTDTVNRLDPEGKDPALRQMVVIGHSQGGLLTKLTVTSTGDRLWRALSDKKLEDLRMSEQARAELRRCIFAEPVPGVKRVIFVSTPHRGSFLASGFARKLAAGLVSLPGDMVRYAREQTKLGGKDEIPSVLHQRIPTSLDGMSGQNPGMSVLAEMPPAPGVTSHSIIAVKGNGPVEKENDGVVTYQSAHVNYTASELIVKSQHSCQSQSATIEEVRRILLEHLANLPPPPQ